MKKRIMAFLVVAAIAFWAAFGCACTKLFIYGSVVQANSVYVDTISYKNGKINIKGDYGLQSAWAFSGYKYRIRGDKLYIKMRWVFVNLFHETDKFDINIDLNGQKVTEVYFEDENNNISKNLLQK